MSIFTHQHIAHVTPDAIGGECSPLFRAGLTMMASCPNPTQITQTSNLVLIDLRTPEEVADAAAPSFSIVHSLPMRAEGLVDVEFPTAPYSASSRYAGIVLRNGAAIVAVLESVLDALPNRICVACSAGKDRSGLVLGLLMRFLGVPNEQIRLASEGYVSGILGIPQCVLAYAEVLGVSAEALKRRFLSSSAAQQYCLESLEREYGSIQRLLEEIGLRPIVQDALTRKFAQAVKQIVPP